jgi:hypothetical protein
MKKLAEVRCPTCKKKGAWWSGPFGPFCSRRCKLADLGKWLNEEYGISEPLCAERQEQPPEAGPKARPEAAGGNENE